MKPKKKGKGAPRASAAAWQAASAERCENAADSPKRCENAENPQRRSEIDAAIETLEDKIAFLSVAFADVPKTMEYCAALRLAVTALEKEAGL